MNDEADGFVDEYLNLHERRAVLGRSGQGVVYRTADPDLAVKVAFDGNGCSPALDRFARRLGRVRSLPVPPDVPISRPLAVLKDEAGYVMRLLEEMEPFWSFWPLRSPARIVGQDLPAWLSGLKPELASDLLGYRDGGSVRRRLAALHKCAVALARLHAAGLVYGDVSPANAFADSDPSSPKVWLIDVDNLRFETPGAGPGIFTPKFGAPEVVQGLDGSRPRTDCYAFAVMAFWMLTMLHPFIGAAVEQVDGEDWADDRATGGNGLATADGSAGGNAGWDTIAGGADERAYARLLPWIGDLDDDSNHKESGLVELVLTDELADLFQETFGRGRTRPWLRPTMFQWAPALARAADIAVVCADCGMGHLLEPSEPGQNCPYCATARPPMFLAEARDWRGVGESAADVSWNFAREWPEDGALVLPRRLFHPYSLVDGDRDAVELKTEGGELRMTSCNEGRPKELAFALDREGDDMFREFVGSAAIPLVDAGIGFWLRTGGPHPRVLRCRILGEPQ